MNKLAIFVHDGMASEVVLQGDEVIIGRDPSCGVCLDDPQVSRRHARLRLTAFGVFVSDLQSKNGTWLDGRRVQGLAELRDGLLTIGRNKLFLAGAGVRAAPDRAVASDAGVAAYEQETQMMGDSQETYARAQERLAMLDTGGFSLMPLSPSAGDESETGW